MQIMPNMSENNTGFAIALAWPATYCKQPGSWYDDITHQLKISTNRFYQVGHAALVLVNTNTKKCYYFDFGRYHAPFQHGRVRGEMTDPGLAIKTQAQISEDGTYIENFREILEELQRNHECHGDGDLHAAYVPVDFEKAFSKSCRMQENSPIPYGPFKIKGSNCSRFVCTSILAGQPQPKYALRLKYLVFLTPTPLDNVNALMDKQVVPKPSHQPVLRPAPFSKKELIKTTLPEPPRHMHIPQNAQWLSGEGAGSWFLVESMQDNENYLITRLNEGGEIECKGVFKSFQPHSFDISRPYKVEHLSHYSKVTISQNGRKIELQRIDEDQGADGKEAVAEQRCAE